MNLYTGPINRLIDELAALPGIGENTAQRLAFYIINLPQERVTHMAHALTEAREKVHYCNLVAFRILK